MTEPATSSTDRKIPSGSGGHSRFHLLMVGMLLIWGLDLPVAKGALEVVPDIPLLTVKYGMGMVVLGIVAAAKKRLRRPTKRDLGLVALTTAVGHIIYYMLEYRALDVVPVANITIILSFVPILTALLEHWAYGRGLSGRMVVFMMICVAGIALTVAPDLLGGGVGSAAGYLLCVGCMICWISYLFFTEKMGETLDALCIAFYQTTLAFLVTLPYTATHLDTIPPLPSGIIIQLLYLGIISEGLGFMIEVTGIQKLGPTISAVYSNFLPITTAIFGILLLGQSLTWLQIIGGGIVIGAGVMVIREKTRLGMEI